MSARSVHGEGVTDDGRAYSVVRRGGKWSLEFRDGGRSRRVTLHEAVDAATVVHLGTLGGREFDARWYELRGISQQLGPIRQFVIVCECGCGQPVNLAPKASQGLKRFQPYRVINGHRVPLPTAPRFWERVEKTETCWLWTGATNGGYGQLKVNRTIALAHRISYELHVGPIPAGLVIDHLCRVTSCVNPAHLEPVPQRINVLRGISPAAMQARQTHCKDGHEFTPENTIRDSRNKRRCRTCSNASDRRRRQLAKQAKEAS